MLIHHTHVLRFLIISSSVKCFNLKLLKHKFISRSIKISEDKINLLEIEGDIIINLLEEVLIFSNIPWPEYFSIHPWSKDLIDWCAINIGYLNINCVERGTKNHIEVEAMWSIFNIIVLVNEIEYFVEFIQPHTNPVASIIIGINL